jgi:hypothetical protein
VTTSNLPNWDNLRGKYSVQSSQLRLEIEGEVVKFGLVLRIAVKHFCSGFGDR